MTLLQIDIMLHYYARTEDYRFGDFSAPAVREAIDSFVLVTEMLRASTPEEGYDPAYRITDKGRAYVDYMCSVPLPTVKYVIEYPHE